MANADLNKTIGLDAYVVKINRFEEGGERYEGRLSGSWVEGVE